jgi:hypothetical protein
MAMTENINVVCTVDRYWDTGELCYKGTDKNGVLIDVSSENSDEETGKLITVGVVLFTDNTFGSIPLEYIRKITV